MRIWTGRCILVIAVIHAVFGLIFFRDVPAPVVREGVFDTVRIDATSHRNVGFWFVTSGLLLFVVGGLLDRFERLGIRFPAFVPWSLLAIAIFGSMLMPVSAFWLLFLPVIGAFLQRRVPEDVAVGS